MLLSNLLLCSQNLQASLLTPFDGHSIRKQPIKTNKTTKKRVS